MPTADKKIHLPFRIDLTSSLIGTQNLMVTFASPTVLNNQNRVYNMVEMDSNPQYLNIIGCDPLLEVLDGITCKSCQPQVDLLNTGPAICNS